MPFVFIADCGDAQLQLGDVFWVEKLREPFYVGLWRYAGTIRQIPCIEQ